VIAVVKDNGFRWDGTAKVWTRPIGFTTQAQDRLIGSRTYQHVVGMILDEKGLSRHPENEPF
jgi:hypothetical protein